MSQIEKGKKVPSDLVLAAIERAFGARMDWLRSGSGPIFIEGAHEPSPHRIRQEKEPPHFISLKAEPELYRLLSIYKDASPAERERFLGIAFAYFRDTKKK